jgi:hypothetical protein
LETFFARRESEHFAFSKAAFEYIIPQARSKLALRGEVVVSWIAESYQKERDQFLALLDQCLTLQTNELAVQLLEASSHSVHPNPGSYNLAQPAKVWSEILVPIALVLDKHSVESNSALVEATKTFFAVIIRDNFCEQLAMRYLNWTHKSLRCASEKCSPCWNLCRFLNSKHKRTWRYAADDASREHVEQVLSGHEDSFEITTEGITSPILAMMKRTPRPSDGVKKYNEAVEMLQSQLAKFEADTVRSLLGDDGYRQVICLESMKVADNAAKVKREADEEAVGEAGKKVKLANRPKECNT